MSARNNSGSGSKSDGSSGEGPESGPEAEEKSADEASVGDPLMPQRAFVNHSSLAFASFSAYRLSATHFVVVGHSLVNTVLGNTVTNLSCDWHYRDASGTPHVASRDAACGRPRPLLGPRLPLVPH